MIAVWIAAACALDITPWRRQCEHEIEVLLAPNPHLFDDDPLDFQPDIEWLESWQEQEESRSFIADVADKAWGLVKTFGLDIAYLATAPLRINKHTIVPALTIAGIFGAAAVLDEPLQRWVQRHRTERWDDIFDTFEQPGNNIALEAGLIAVGAVAYVAGWNDWMLEMGLTAIEARFICVPLVSVLKEVVG